LRKPHDFSKLTRHFWVIMPSF